jgi:hypothetical protein
MQRGVRGGAVGRPGSSGPSRCFFNWLRASSFICVPNAVSQSDSQALGAAAGKAALEGATREAGFSHFRLAAETPFYLILEVRP